MFVYYSLLETKDLISSDSRDKKSWDTPGITPEMQGTTWNIYNTLAHIFRVDYSSG